MVDRDRRLSMLLSEEEKAMLAALAERAGLSASDYIRQIIRREHAKAFPDRPQAPSGKPQR